jgi:hypothetical protein
MSGSSMSNAHRTSTLVTIIVLFASLCFPITDATAGETLQLPDTEFNGQTSQTVSLFRLPQSFSFTAEVRIDASNQWRHLIEVGGREYTWHCPLRIEVGNQGQWYIAVGDGTSYVDADFQGSWSYGVWTKILFTYVNGVGKFYENDKLIKEFAINKNVGAVQGSLILGSYKGTERFFQGAIRNGRIVAGELTTGPTTPPPQQPRPPASGDPSLILHFAPNPTTPRAGIVLQKGKQIGTVPASDMKSHTVAFWIKPTQTISGWGSILHVGASNDQRQPGFLFYPGQTRIHYRQATVSNANDGVDPGFQLRLSEWTHVAVVWTNQGSNTQVRIYYNGQVQAEQYKPHPLGISGNQNVWAGNPWAPNAQAFIDDVRIYNRGLSQQEVVGLAQQN